MSTSVLQHWLNSASSRRTVAFFAMISASIALSSGGLIVRNIEYASPAQINLYRNLSFFVVISAIFLLRYRSQAFNQIKRVSAPIIWAALCLATTGFAIVQSLTHTLVANTVFIMSTVPFIAMILAFLFFKERVSKVMFVTMLVCLAGLIVMIGKGLGTGSTYGNLMALVAAFGFASFAVIARAHHHLEMLPALMIAALLIVIVSAVSSNGDMSINAHDFWLCSLWGAAISGTAHWIFILSARYLAAAELTLFDLLESSLAPIWVWVFINEIPDIWTIFGGVAIIFSVGFVAFSDMVKARRFS